MTPRSPSCISASTNNVKSGPSLPAFLHTPIVNYIDAYTPKIAPLSMTKIHLSIHLHIGVTLFRQWGACARLRKVPVPLVLLSHVLPAQVRSTNSHRLLHTPCFNLGCTCPLVQPLPVHPIFPHIQIFAFPTSVLLNLRTPNSPYTSYFVLANFENSDFRTSTFSYTRLFIRAIIRETDYPCTLFRHKRLSVQAAFRTTNVPCNPQAPPRTAPPSNFAPTTTSYSWQKWRSCQKAKAWLAGADTS